MREETTVKKSKLEIVCYAASAIALIAAIFMTVTNVLYVYNYMSAYGYSFADMWSDVISYIISGFVPYFTYAVLAFVAAKVIAYINPGEVVCVETACAEDVEAE